MMVRTSLSPPPVDHANYDRRERHISATMAPASPIDACSGIAMFACCSEVVSRDVDVAIVTMVIIIYIIITTSESTLAPLAVII